MKKYILNLLTIFWLILIFYLSSQNGNISGDLSNGLIYKILSNIFQLFNMNSNNINDLILIIHNPIRELMHAFEYFVLAILLYKTLQINNIKENKITITVLFCLIYAITDEIHQLFVPGRSFEYYDILLDTLGSILGILICFIKFKIKS